MEKDEENQKRHLFKNSMMNRSYLKEITEESTGKVTVICPTLHFTSAQEDSDTECETQKTSEALISTVTKQNLMQVFNHASEGKYR